MNQNDIYNDDKTRRRVIDLSPGAAPVWAQWQCPKHPTAEVIYLDGNLSAACSKCGDRKPPKTAIGETR